MREFYAAANVINSHVKFASEVTVLFNSDVKSNRIVNLDSQFPIIKADGIIYLYFHQSNGSNCTKTKTQ